MELSLNDLDSDPFSQFESWYQDAIDHEDITQPNAMCIATVDADNRPDVRYVLLKSFDHRGFVFYTNLNSKKGRQLRDNPNIAVTIYWQPLGRQIRIRGEAKLVEDEQADAYFSTRARGSQLGAWASHQSHELDNRQTLLERHQKFKENFSGQDIPRPDWWSGFRIIPTEFEFWKSRENRLHDRFYYHKHKGDWKITRLNP